MAAPCCCRSTCHGRSSCRTACAHRLFARAP
uniref:Uncharacterized protein n=1 Tax=Arundo donax TaxID=35708 RepID=A0A0A9HCY7_ARUDO